MAEKAKIARNGAHADVSLGIAQREMIGRERIERRLATFRLEQMRKRHDQKATGENAHRHGYPAHLATAPIAEVAHEWVREDGHELVDRLKQAGLGRCHVEAGLERGHDGVVGTANDGILNHVARTDENEDNLPLQGNRFRLACRRVDGNLVDGCIVVVVVVLIHSVHWQWLLVVSCGRNRSK